MFSCVETSKEAQPAFELDNWTIHEVAFFAALLLGNGPHSIFRAYPMPIFSDMALDDPEQLIEDAQPLQQTIKKMATDVHWMRGNAGIVPSSFEQYQLIELTDDCFERIAKVWSEIDINNPVLIRGLHAILKSNILSNHFQFLDSALSMSHVALDALFELVRERLSSAGMPNSTSKDAQAFVEDLHGWPRSGRKFFEDYYSDRVRNFHTNSKHGAEFIPFFSHDDRIELNEYMLASYFTLITGDVYTKTAQDVEYYCLSQTQKD